MFTIKTTRPTGKYKSFYSNLHEVKLKGKVVGSIEDNSTFTIRLMVMKKDIMEDKNPNCEWKWIALKNEFASLNDAKLFLKENYKEITRLFKLKMLDV